MATAPIRKSGETINARYQFNANGLSMALERAFGFAPVILSPFGGARTKDQCIAMGTSWRASDHYEDSPNAALDIDNQARYRAIDEDLFLRICAQFGWFNVQIGGRPFPPGVERWHFRCITPMAAPLDWAGTINPAPIYDTPTERGRTMNIHRSGAHEGDFLIDGNRNVKFQPFNKDNGGRAQIDQTAKDLSIPIGTDDTFLNSTILAWDLNAAAAKANPGVWFAPLR